MKEIIGSGASATFDEKPYIRPVSVKIRVIRGEKDGRISRELARGKDRPGDEPVRRAQGPELVAGRRPYSPYMPPPSRPWTEGNLAENGRNCGIGVKDHPLPPGRALGFSRASTQGRHAADADAGGKGCAAAPARAGASEARCRAVPASDRRPRPAPDRE